MKLRSLEGSRGILSLIPNHYCCNDCNNPLLRSLTAHHPFPVRARNLATLLLLKTIVIVERGATEGTALLSPKVAQAGQLSLGSRPSGRKKHHKVRGDLRRFRRIDRSREGAINHWQHPLISTPTEAARGASEAQQ